MKTLSIILTALIVLLAIAGDAAAQQYSSTSLYSSGTNAISANSTNAISQAIPVTKNRNIGVQLTFTAATGNTGNVGCTFATSLDGVNYQSTPGTTLTVAANGTNAVTGVTNIDTGGAGFLKAVNLTNAANTLTNVSVQASKKPGN